MRERNPGDPIVKVDDGYVGIAVNGFQYYEIELTDLQRRWDFWRSHMRAKGWWNNEYDRALLDVVVSADDRK